MKVGEVIPTDHGPAIVTTILEVIKGETSRIARIFLVCGDIRGWVKPEFLTPALVDEEGG